MKIYFKLFIILGVAATGLGAYLFFRKPSVSAPSVSLTAPHASTVSPASTTLITPEASIPPTPSPEPINQLPGEAALTVTYTMQAPFNKWDALHEDACEEASLVMVKHFLDGTVLASPEQADKEITDLVNFEVKNDYGPSITLQELKEVANLYFGLKNGTVKQVTSVNDIKKLVTSGHPVILGMAGKLLPNPYFSNGGPNYHMLIVKGYDASGFITNEPGTWHGDGFHYSYQTFYNAIHDWNPSNILTRSKEGLVFE